MAAELPSADVDPARLVSAHQAGLWRYLRLLGCAGAEAEDLMQDTFVDVLRSPPEDRGPRALAGYLRRVARNLLLKRRRRQRLEPDLVEFDRLDAAYDRLLADDRGEARLEALRLCLDGVDSRSRELLRRHYRDGASRTELGAEFAMGDDGVKSWLRRLRARLRACIERRLRP